MQAISLQTRVSIESTSKQVLRQQSPLCLLAFQAASSWRTHGSYSNDPPQASHRHGHQAAHAEAEMPSSALLPTARASDRVAHSRRHALLLPTKPRPTKASPAADKNQPTLKEEL